MKIPKIEFIETHPNAKLPKANNTNHATGDTGLDVYSVVDLVIPPRGSTVVNVGLTVAYITPGYWFKIEARSGLGFKYGIQPHGGIIDNGYRGNLSVKLYNLTDDGYNVKAGDRIAQLVVYELIQPNCSVASNSSTTDRGSSGFGSTGR